MASCFRQPVAYLAKGEDGVASMLPMGTFLLGKGEPHASTRMTASPNELVSSPTPPPCSF